MLERFDFRDNAIGFLRLFFAAAVVVAHAYVLGGFGPDFVTRWSSGREDLGTLAVGGFFTLSGFLICRSATKSLFGRFLWHRFLRIFPAFWACLVITIVAFGPLIATIEHRPLRDYLTATIDSPLMYFFANSDLLMRQYGIAGLLAHVPYPRALDGSLWTLRIEFACYLLIAIVALLGAIGRWRVVLAALAIGLYVLDAIAFSRPELAPHLGPFSVIAATKLRLGLQLAMYFFLGGTAYAYRHVIPLNRAVGVLGLVLAIVCLRSASYAFVFPLALAAATLWLAAELPFKSIDRRVDLSYGLYIYAFPFQQLAAAIGFSALGLVPSIGIPMILALGAAWVSWTVVEKPALSLKNMPLPTLRKKSLRK